MREVPRGKREDEESVDGKNTRNNHAMEDTTARVLKGLGPWDGLKMLAAVVTPPEVKDETTRQTPGDDRKGRKLGLAVIEEVLAPGEGGETIVGQADGEEDDQERKKKGSRPH